jgi:formylglycine-generating enzyme required for sulfatase activity
MTEIEQVFISHATADAQFAHRLADDLQRLGVRVWIAPESIRPGESWVSAIERGLRESSHAVVVLTPAALESKWVKKETDVTIAQERKGRIQVIPLDVEPCEVPLLLSSYQMVSFRRDYDAGLSQLADILGVRIPPEPEVPVPPPVVKKPVEKKVAPPLVEPVAVAKTEPEPPTAPPASEAVPKKVLMVGALVAGGLVLLALVARIAVLAIIRPWPPPTQKPPIAVPVVRVTTPTPTSTPTATPIPPTDAPVPPTDTPPPSTPADMVHVPAGEFTMGSNEGESDEQPVNTVYLDAFYIDEYEVTNGQFAQFLNEQGNQEEGGVTWVDIGAEYCLITESEGQYQPRSGYSDHPVVEVSWYGARAYCQWAGKGLPTEAEWEKAARGTDGRTYPWGEGIDCDHAQYGKCGGQTMLVGSKPKGASPYGALDMAGNVWEWVADWYDSGYYATSPESNPRGPTSEDCRVIRGGSWYDLEAFARCRSRLAHP